MKVLRINIFNIFNIYMTLVFNVTPDPQVKQVSQVKPPVILPKRRRSRSIQMFPNMGAINKISCGCGK